jgi:hypothetical protein
MIVVSEPSIEEGTGTTTATMARSILSEIVSSIVVQMTRERARGVTITTIVIIRTSHAGNTGKAVIDRSARRTKAATTIAMMNSASHMSVLARTNMNRADRTSVAIVSRKAVRNTAKVGDMTKIVATTITPMKHGMTIGEKKRHHRGPNAVQEVRISVHLVTTHPVVEPNPHQVNRVTDRAQRQPVQAPHAAEALLAKMRWHHLDGTALSRKNRRCGPRPRSDDIRSA